MSVASGCQNNGLVGVALVLGDLAVVPGSFFGWRSVCLLFCCVYLRGCFGCCGKIRALCILFSPIARKKEPHWQRFREMHAFCAEAGRIFVPCIRFGVQSGDFGYIARESCQGSPPFASRSLESCMGRRSCQRSALRGPLRSGGQPIAKIPDMVAEDCWSEWLNLAIALLLHSKPGGRLGRSPGE